MGAAGSRCIDSRRTRERGKRRAAFHAHARYHRAFPHERRPKIVWIGCRDQGAPYRALAYAARSAFEPLGFTFEKNAVAHVTIARVKGGLAHLPMLDVAPMQVHVTQAVLFESLPAGRTTRYEVRHRAPLNPGA